MKFVKYILYLLLAISAIITILFYANGGSESMVSLMLNWSYILFGICALGAIILPFFCGDGKGFKSTLIKVVAFLAVAVISYLLASGAPVEVVTTEQATPRELKFTDTIIIFTGTLLCLGVVSIVAGGIINLYRNR